MSLNNLTGDGGCEYVGDTNARTSKAYGALKVESDTVIATLTYRNSHNGTTDAVTDIGLSGKTLKQGAFITCPAGNCFVALTLTSGAVIAYHNG